MKAIVKNLRSGELELSVIKDPEPGSNEIRVLVKAAGVNPVDWKLVGPGAMSMAWWLLKPSGRVPVGMDFAGVVDAVGSRVKRVRPGMKVVGGSRTYLGEGGSYAEKVVVSESQVCPLPEGFDLAAAGALPIPGVTAWLSLVDTGKLKKGQRALILGASGGVGHIAVQIAKNICGAFTVGVCSSRNEALVKSLGADVVVDYGKGDPLEQAKAHGPYQVVMDCVGDYSPSRCRELLAPGGRHINIAPQSAAAIAGIGLSPVRSRSLTGIPNGRLLKPLVEAVANDRIKVVVSHRIPLAETARAHAQSQTGRTVGKIVLIP